MTAPLPVLSEARAERIADREVQRRLASDRAYLNAQDAEAQAARENEIASEVWASIVARYLVA